MLTFRNIRRYINQNIRNLIFILFVVIFCIMIIQTLNTVAKQKNEKQLEENEKNVSNTTNQDNYSVMSDRAVSQEKTKQNLTIIDEFFKNCKQQNVEEAYNLLSDACKQEQFPQLDNFIENYYKKILEGKTDYKTQAWVENEYTTYRVQIFDNILATGKADSGYVEDYYTIVKENGENKLNINNYIFTKEINKDVEHEGIIIGINSVKIYKDYQIYNVKIKNTNEEAIMIDSKQKNNSVYIKDEKDGKYIGYMYEIPDNLLIFEQGYERNLNIKFNKIYNTKKINKIYFSDIIRNYNEYINMKNKTEYEAMTIQIDI